MSPLPPFKLSIKCHDLPCEKLSQRDVEQALVKNSATSLSLDGGCGDTPWITPALREGSTSQTAGDANSTSASGGVGDRHTLSEEEEADLDDFTLHGGLDGSLRETIRTSSNIIVQVDPLLAESSASSAQAAPKSSSAAAAAAATTADASAIPAAAEAQVCADDAGGESAGQQIDGGMSSAVSCGCGGRRRGRGTAEAGDGV